MPDPSYWEECIASSLEEHGVSASEAQISAIAGDVEIYHQNYGMAHGHHAIPNPLEQELETMRRELEKERQKVLCRECSGKGWIQIQGPYHGTSSECSRCRGEGRHA